MLTITFFDEVHSTTSHICVSEYYLISQVEPTKERTTERMTSSKLQLITQLWRKIVPINFRANFFWHYRLCFVFARIIHDFKLSVTDEAKCTMCFFFFDSCFRLFVCQTFMGNVNLVCSAWKKAFGNPVSQNSNKKFCEGTKKFSWIFLTYIRRFFKWCHFNSCFNLLDSQETRFVFFTECFFLASSLIRFRE